MKLTKPSLIILIILLSATTQAQLISNAPPLPMTNTVEIGHEIAEVVLADLDVQKSGVERHLVLDTASGRVKGVLHHMKSDRVFMFDSGGLLDLIIKQADEGDPVYVFNTRGEWLYTVKNNRYLFDAKGQMTGVLRLSGDQVVFHRLDGVEKKNPAKRRGF